MKPPEAYPDISDILARKAEGRKRAAAMSFTEKIEWLEKARAELAPFAELRKQWRAKRARIGSIVTPGEAEGRGKGVQKI